MGHFVIKEISLVKALLLFISQHGVSVLLLGCLCAGREADAVQQAEHTERWQGWWSLHCLLLQWNSNGFISAAQHWDSLKYVKGLPNLSVCPSYLDSYKDLYLGRVLCHC